MKFQEKHVAVVLAVLIALWVILSLSGLDVRWLGVEVDGGLLPPPLHRSRTSSAATS